MVLCQQMRQNVALVLVYWFLIYKPSAEKVGICYVITLQEVGCASFIQIHVRIEGVLLLLDVGNLEIHTLAFVIPCAASHCVYHILTRLTSVNYSDVRFLFFLSPVENRRWLSELCYRFLLFLLWLLFCEICRTWNVWWPIDRRIYFRNVLDLERCPFLFRLSDIYSASDDLRGSFLIISLDPALDTLFNVLFL